MLNLPSAKPRLMKAVFRDNPLLPDRWKSTALQSVSVIDCWCEIVPTSKMVRAATNTADNHEKTALCARPQEMKIQQYGGSGCAPFCNGHTWAKVQITDLLTRTCWLGWSPRHVKCRSACKLDSPNYHINDVSSFIRLRACISIVHFYHIEYSKLSTKHQILTDRILSYLHKTDRIFHGPGKTTSRTYVKCFKKVGIDSHK